MKSIQPEKINFRNKLFKELKVGAIFVFCDSLGRRQKDFHDEGFLKEKKSETEYWYLVKPDNILPFLKILEVKDGFIINKNTPVVEYEKRIINGKDVYIELPGIIEI